VHRLFLDVAESNSAAIGLYARLGFTQMGRRKAYYAHADGSREDALLMVYDVRAASR
jgi:ribosomal-protein-alanine N-acetyltransferase